MSLKAGATNWLAWAGFALAVAGIIYQSGGVTQRIADNDKRITRLEVMAQEVNSVNIRLARIEAKLEFLAEQTASKGTRSVGN